jgi:hypothetical protein
MVRSRMEAPAAARSGFRRLRRPAVLRRRAVSMVAVMVAAVMAASVTVAASAFIPGIASGAFFRWYANHLMTRLKDE